MNATTDLAPADDATALAELEARESALAAQVQDENEDLVLPRLKLTQQQSREVNDGSVDSGEFINSITGQSYGPKVELIIVHRFKGRLYEDKEQDRLYFATGPVAPDNWPDEFAGKPFADIPEAEEQHKARANAPGGSWGKGPKIQTTYNYVGFVPEDPQLPVRLSLKASAASTAKKLDLLLRSGGAPTASVYEFEAVPRDKPKPHFVPLVKRGRQATVEERQVAVRLAEAVQAHRAEVEGRFQDAASDESNAPKPVAAEDSLDVS